MLGANGIKAGELTSQAFAQVYDQLRQEVRRRRYGNGGSLTGTALLNEALLRVVAAGTAGTTHVDLEKLSAIGDLMGYVHRVIGSVLVDRWRNKQRHHPVDALRVNQLLDGLNSVSAKAEASVLDADMVDVMHRMLNDLRKDPHVKNAERVATIVACRVLYESTIPEAAAVAKSNTKYAKHDWAFFQAWARIWCEHDRAEVMATLTRLRKDSEVTNREGIARSVELELIHYKRVKDIAVELKRTEAEVDQMLTFFRSYATGDAGRSHFEGSP